MTDRTIIHLSDFHFGLFFDKTKFDSLKIKINDLKPNLIIVTGDLVNSPWPWSLRKAKTLLEQLRSSADNDCRLVVIPGNHDTRLQGILAVSQMIVFGVTLISFALVFALVVGLLKDMHWKDIASLLYHLKWKAYSDFLGGWNIPVGVLLCVGVILIFIRFFLTTNLEKYLNGLLINIATPFPDLRIGILPFDSAREGILCWARGNVSDKELLPRPVIRDPTHQDDLFWIAAVHHHLLPLPYDSKKERMMILDNAGALLSELRNRRVRLVLHGHKHHPHFARIAIDPTREQSMELAVLSAGTPTEKKSQGNSRHGFNVIRIRDDDTIAITQYEAELDGYTFQDRPEFEMEPPELHGWTEHNRLARRHQIRADLLVAKVKINCDGDGVFRREYYGVRVDSNFARIETIGDQIIAETVGHVEGFEADCLSGNFTTLRLQIDKASREVHRMVGTIRFTDQNGQGGLQRGSGSIDFYTQFYANNAIALWEDELRHLYPDESARREEWITFIVLGGLPVREARFVIEFPVNYKCPNKVEALVKNANTTSTWRPLGNHSVTRLDGDGGRVELLVAVAYPLPNHYYQLKWSVPRREGESTAGQEESQAKAEELARWLIEHRQSEEFQSQQLCELLKAVEWIAKKRLGTENSSMQRYCVTIYGYDELEHKLRWSASLDGGLDKRKDWVFRYGNGLAGRAFRTAQITTFRKGALKNGTVPRPWRYLPGEDKVIDNIGDIEEYVVIAVPLVATRSFEPVSILDTGKLSGVPYGVLKISTEESKAWLDASDNTKLFAFATVVNEIILLELENIVGQFAQPT